MTTPYIPYPRDTARSTAAVAGEQVVAALDQYAKGTVTARELSDLIVALYEHQFANGWFAHVNAVRTQEENPR